MRLSGLTKFRVSNSGAGSGNALASDLLSGKTASVDAGDIVGTMPNKVGSGTVITPGTADIAIPQGYFGGSLTDGKVVGDANLIAANILSGISIFGITGTGGKRYASGSVTSSTTSATFYYVDGTTAPTYSITVSGLAFKPSIIIAKYSSGWDYVSVYEEVSGGLYPKTIKVAAFNSTTYTTSNLNFKGDVAPASVVNGSFTIAAYQSGAVYNWLAIE